MEEIEIKPENIIYFAVQNGFLPISDAIKWYMGEIDLKELAIIINQNM